ncbi:hypothetical protein ACIQAC_27910 [Streptomyces sp. NPDC088387]|uniref:hypothetical protein n=1 Tax=Streptomyces sp. NPDC088387 TaxID=3365859 RepID=UPI003811C981
MGIESDQVVYEYLSRVGDVAQQRQLPSSTRMRLVSQLRDEIDRRRAKVSVDSPAAVRRILTGLGSPDEIVAAAGGTAGAPDTPTAVPVQRDGDEETGRGKRLRRVVPRPRPADPAPPAAEAGFSPHVAPAHELGDSGGMPPDWWRTEGSPFAGGDEVPGFVGGVEIPELLKPPPRKKPAVEAEPEPAVEADVAPDEPKQSRVRRLRVPAVREWNNPLLLLAAALLVAGAVLGNLLALAVGWLIAWASRRLTTAEMKWAVMGLPAVALAGGAVWLWGRNEGRWGAPITEGHMSEALTETWPWVLRAAALASALFLTWRSQRPR